MPDTHPVRARVGMDMSVLRLFNTGTEEFVEGLVGGLAALGVDVVGLGADEPVRADAERLGQPARGKRSPLAKWQWETGGVVREARGAGVTLLHFPYMTHPPRPLSMPTVVNIHDVIPYRFPDYQRRLRDRRYFAALRARLPHATRLVAVSQATADDVAIVFPRMTASVTVIPNGVHGSFFEPPTREGEGELAQVLELAPRRRVLYVGGYQAHKNLDVLLRAAAHVLPDLDAELVLVGAAGLPIVDTVAVGPLAHHARMTGRLSRPALRALYAASTVLAFPSRYEGFGLPPAQALAAGVPVVASRGPALEEVLGEAAVWVDPDSVDDWAGALRDVLTDAAVRDQLVRAGHAQASGFQWSAIADRYRGLYEEVLKS